MVTKVLLDHHTDPAQGPGRVERLLRAGYRAVRPALRTLWALGWFAGLRFCDRRLGRRRRPGPRVLMYHRIAQTTTGSDPELAARPDRFERQLRLLRSSGRNILALEQLLGPDPPPNEGVAITFDDGHRDNLTRAAPILERYSAPATLFLATGFTDSGRPYPWAAQSRDDSGHDCTMLPMTWDEVRELASRGWNIEAHGVSHRDLARLPLDAVAEEMAQSAEAIAHHIGRRPVAFSYPFGSATAETVRLAQTSGYSLQFGAGGWPPLRARTPVDRSDNLLVFRAKLDGAFDIPWGRGLKRWLRRLLHPSRLERSCGPER